MSALDSGNSQAGDGGPVVSALESPTHVLASLEHVDGAAALKADPGAVLLALPGGAQVVVEALAARSLGVLESVLEAEPGGRSEVAAAGAYEGARGVSAELGSQALPWSELTDSEQAAWGVAAVADIGPLELHDRLSAALIADGWAYGEARDGANRQSPDLVPWPRLSAERRVLMRAASALLASS